MKYANNLELFNLVIREFPWNGIYLRKERRLEFTTELL